MNFTINTSNVFSDELINSFFNINGPVCQMDFHSKTLIKNIEVNNTDNIIVDFLNKIKVFLDAQNYDDINIKKNVVLFNKLCFLYFKGGVIINKNILVKNIEKISNLYKNNEICIIKSCVNNSLFDGIMIAKKENVKILELINRVLIDPLIDINTLLLNIVELDPACKLLNEYIILDKSNIYEGEDVSEIIAEHYFKNESLLDKFKLQKNVVNDLSKLKIGITTNIPPNLRDFYSNGIKQNCMYLYELLKNAGYDVKLIIDSDKNIKVLEEIDFYTFDYVTIDDVFTRNFDVIFSMGFSIPNHIYISLKNIGVKIVYYMCGNNYLIDSERILYDQHKTRTINYVNEQKYDQIWIIPQMYNQNKYYSEILQGVKCIEIPFIWSPMSIKFTQKILNLPDDSSLLYKQKESKIGIFEPNISLMKWALPCVLIAENTYKTNKNINHVYITNLNKNKDSDINCFNMDQFNNICRGLELFKDKKITSESRYNTLEFMSKHCDIAISHQWENPLNYLYLDLAWMGWPILHNAHLCKDVGYYYEGFNYYQGSEMLNHILMNHEPNSNEYLNKNRKIINTYIPTNKCLQNKYKNLIENLFI
jgi:hypothetical protein